MNLKLDYSITELEERQKIVNQLCADYPSQLTPQNLETLSNYLLNSLKIPSHEREILTDNRRATINKRETSLDSLLAKFGTEGNNEDNAYQIFESADRNKILSPINPITKKQIKEIPFLQQIRDSINYYKKLPNNYIVHQAKIDLSKDQYLVREAYLKPIKFKKITKSPSAEPCYDALDFTNKKHIALLLQNYSKLKNNYCEEITKDIYWILVDFENLADAALEEKEPILYDILIMKIDGAQNQTIHDALQEKYNTTYSLEYISSLYNNKIPKLIAEEAMRQDLVRHYTLEAKGEWRQCGKCGEVKLLHPLFFNRNKSSPTGFYSICKDCRNRKRKGGAVANGGNKRS